MNKVWRRLQTAGGFLLLGAAVAGCGAGPSQPGSFYVLSSPPDLAAKVSASAKGRHLAVGVGPVQLPPHLDRTQIVTLASRNRLDLKELDQWAEPLKDGFTWVLARNLSALLETDRIFKFPWRSPITVQYQVTVQVVQFDTDAKGRSTLSARWNIIKVDSRELLYSQTSTFISQTQGQGVEPIVAAMSGNLGQLSREISTRIATFRAK